MIGVQTAVGDRPHRVRLFNLGPPVPNGDGGFDRAELPLDPPRLFVKIVPASAADIERVAGGISIAQANHIVTGPFHPGISVDTVLEYDDIRRGKTRQFSVTGVSSPEERAAETVCACIELVP